MKDYIETMFLQTYRGMKFLDKNINELIKKKIKIKSIGEKCKINKKLVDKIKKVEKSSSINYDKL